MSNKAGAAVGAVIFLVIIVIGFVWFLGMFQEQDKLIAADCIPRTFNQYGLATSMVCPGQAGYDTALLSE